MKKELLQLRKYYENRLKTKPYFCEGMCDVIYNRWFGLALRDPLINPKKQDNLYNLIQKYRPKRKKEHKLWWSNETKIGITKRIDFINKLIETEAWK